MLFPQHLILQSPSVFDRPAPVTCPLRIVVREIPTGDYYLDGYRHRMIVERKGSFDELATNCFTTTGRRRFLAECARLLAETAHPVLLIEGTVPDLISRWRGSDSPWLVVDAFQRLCLEHRISIRYIPVSTPAQRRVAGEEVAHLLVNGALTNERDTPLLRTS